MMFWRIALLGLGLVTSTAVSAEEISLANLQCAPVPGGGSAGQAEVSCPASDKRQGALWSNAVAPRDSSW